MANVVKEIALQATAQFFDIASLHLSIAEGTRNDPAGATGIDSVIDAMGLRFGRHRAGTEFLDLFAIGFPLAAGEFPAVDFDHGATS